MRLRDRWRSHRVAAPVVAFLLGALQSLSFAPFNVWILGPGCLAALWWLWRDASPKRAATVGFLFSAGLFCSGTYWLYTSLHVLGGAPVLLALVLMVGLVAIMGTYNAVLGALLGRMSRGHEAAYALLVLPSAWVLMEWVRGWCLSGFPWLALGYAHLDTPLAGFAPLLGVYGVSWLAAMSAGALLLVVTGIGRHRLLACTSLLLVWGAGAALSGVPWTHARGAPLTVALVQGAISQDQKWQSGNQQHTLEVYQALTEQALGARLVVWPESALPLLYEEAIPYLAAIYRRAQDAHSDLLFGLIRYDAAAGELHNGLMALSDHEEWYYKRRLVPFGEFFPVPAFIRSWMRLKNMTYVDFSPGSERQGVLHAGGQTLAATICYEDAYGVEQLNDLAEATLLVNVSNDAWFGDSTAPHQHLQITRMRALEAGRFMMRATNNGVSAVIDNKGHVLAQSAQFVPQVLRAQVVPFSGLTPYARLKNWPVLGWCTAVLAWVLVARWRRRASRP